MSSRRPKERVQDSALAAFDKGSETMLKKGGLGQVDA